jgi:hypothetical protein
MKTEPVFATIDIKDHRKITIRKFMPAEKLKQLMKLLEMPDFSSASLKDYAEYDVSIRPAHPFKQFTIGIN